MDRQRRKGQRQRTDPSRRGPALVGFLDGQDQARSVVFIRPAQSKTRPSTAFARVTVFVTNSNCMLLISSPPWASRAIPFPPPVIVKQCPFVSISVTSQCSPKLTHNATMSVSHILDHVPDRGIHHHETNGTPPLGHLSVWLVHREPSLVPLPLKALPLCVSLVLP